MTNQEPPATRKSCLEGMWNLRVPALTAILSVIFLALIPQTQEVYRILALGAPFTWNQALLSLAFVFILSLFIWLSGSAIAIKKQGKKEWNENTKKPLNNFWIPTLSLLGTLPFAGILGGLLLIEPTISSNLPQKIFLNFSIIFIIILGLSFFVLSISRNYNIAGKFFDNYLLRAKDEDVLFPPALFVSIACIWILIFFLSIFNLPAVPHEIKIFIPFFIPLLMYLIAWRTRNFEQSLPVFLFVLFINFLLFVAASNGSLSIRAIGPITVLASFLIVFVTLFSHISQGKFPFNIGFLLILVFFVSLFDLNDNHRLRMLQPEISGSLPSIEKSITDWVESEARKREILEFKDNRKQYPIYVVSAQGGGIFAAYHAAATLSRMQDLCPAFAHHVFAISGVSGGSLGAAAFSSLVKIDNKFTPDCPGKAEQLVEKRGPLENKAHQLLDQDLLSPVLATGLFPDFLQRFLPAWFGPLSDSVDRARALEYAFEQGWKSEWSQSNPLSSSFYDHWNPKDAAPALVLNATVVETGERLLFSPFTFPNPTSSDLKVPILQEISSVACSESGFHISFPLSTAAVLSARFPLVTPVGWFDRCFDKYGNLLKEKAKSRLADGGYFENSGVSTALEIGQILEEKLPDFKIIYLALTNDNPPLTPKAGGLNELLSPINAAFNAREATGRSVIEKAGYEKNKDSIRFRKFLLTHYSSRAQISSCPLDELDENKCNEKDNSEFKLPLGWYLSKHTQDYIRDKIGNPKSCYGAYKDDTNHCVMRDIIDELSLVPSNS